MEESKNKYVNGESNVVSGSLNEINEMVIRDDKYRYDRILELQSEMKNEKNKYEMIYKKYKKGEKICTGVSVGSNFIGTSCSTSAVATSLTVVAIPIAIPLAVLGGISYVSAILSTAVGKNISAKRSKHMAIFQLARNTCIVISRSLSHIISDGKIDVREFDMICEIVEGYYKQKDDLRKRKVDLEKLMHSATKKAETTLSKKLQNYLQR